MKPGQKAYEASRNFTGGDYDWSDLGSDARARWASVEAACAPQMPADVAALVERLEGTIYHPSAGELIPSADELAAASALQAQAAELIRLREDRDSHQRLAIDAMIRAEAAEAKLREAVDLLLSAPLEPQCDWKCGEGTSHGPCNCNMREWLNRQSDLLSSLEQTNDAR